MSVHSACECVGRRQESHFNVVFKLLMAVHLRASVNSKWGRPLGVRAGGHH